MADQARTQIQEIQHCLKGGNPNTPALNINLGEHVQKHSEKTSTVKVDRGYEEKKEGKKETMINQVISRHPTAAAAVCQALVPSSK